MPEPVPSPASADRNLLFGILALQMDFVTRDALIRAMNAWVLEKHRPLGAILVEQQALAPERHALLEALVREHLRQHGDDPQKSLAAVSPIGSVRRDLEQVPDPDLHASLAHVSAARASEDNVCPTYITAGAPTSWGQRFRVLRPHARGGLGEVFVARDEELHREVALKQIQAQRDDPPSRARFLLEAEVTGCLEHPGVVPVYGLGAHPDGRPYYAMRLIKGDSLQDTIGRFHFADRPRRDPGERRLALRGLLGRFVAVCNAVAYAHSRGVLHRDLKPANVMLGPYGETLVVDWGLAKVVGRPAGSDGASEGTLRPTAAEGSDPTRVGSAIGTPAYMSPEQAAGRVDELGPPSDVYSLGATLYCLLAGQAPFDGAEAGEVLRKVQAGDFPPPRAIKRQVPAALEAVCRKAMALRPGGRYGTARALADDMEHWLADEPVSAYREPWPARLARWGRRHRPLVAAAAALLLTALMGASLFAWQAEQGRRQESKRLAQIEKANDILLSVFRDLDPYEEKEGKLLRARLGERLDRAAELLEGEAVGEPLAVARLQAVLGETQRNLGFAERAIALQSKARQTFEAQLGSDHPDTLGSMSNLASAYRQDGQLDKAIPLFEQTLEKQKANLGPDHPDTLTTMYNLAIAYWEAGQLDKAVPLHEQTVEKRKANLGPDHPDTLTCMCGLAQAYQAAGQLDKALPLFEQTLEKLKAKLGPDHPDTLGCMHSLAEAYRGAGELDKAVPLYEQAVEKRKAKLGPDHPDTLSSMCGLAVAYFSAGQLDKAVPLQEQTLEKYKAKLGPDHPYTLASMNNLANAYYAAGQLDKAVPLFEQTLEKYKAKLSRCNLDLEPAGESG
jgi:serine/threonine protein kinase/lipopolysaccharide biosynthesis regulator YciM